MNARKMPRKSSRRMVKAGNTMSIGPMSAVAGTISALAVEAMVEAGATYAIVDNGGDIHTIKTDPLWSGYMQDSPLLKTWVLY